MDRYVAIQEPTCTWAVFDAFEDVPAEIGGVVLVGLERAEAEELACSANAERALRMRMEFSLGRLRLVARRAA